MTPLRALLRRGACMLAIVPAGTASAADWTLDCPTRLATAQAVAGVTSSRRARRCNFGD
jgi:hypothetical protein